MWQLIQQQQQQITELKRELESVKSRSEVAVATVAGQADKLESTIARVEATADMVERAGTGDTRDVAIGGYGEMHYNNLDDGDQIDLHRFVLFFGHAFTDSLSFYSELEVEHAFAGKGGPGEVELEQAFVQWDYAPGHNTRMGVFLLPLGLLNETHEPDTFYGVERNSIEKQIIPSTWWEGGVAFTGEIAPGWGYDVAIHSGLDLDTANPKASTRSSVRSARQKVAEANASKPAYTARLSFTGIPGFTWRTAVHYETDMTAGDADGFGIGEIDGTLIETNISLQRGMFGLRALYARWDIDDQINLLNPGADRQTGWLLEPSLRFDNGLGVFARYGAYDLTAGTSVSSDARRQLDVGVNYWLADGVVIKADLQRQRNDKGADIDGINLGVGYSF